MSIEEQFDLGLAAYHRNDMDSAEDHFGTILKEQPQHHNSMNYLGLINLQRGNTQNAIDWWMKSIATEENFDAISNLGYLYSQIQKNDLAKRMLEKAFKLKPERTDSAVQWAHIEALEGNYDKAISILEPLLELKPIDENVYILLSKIYGEQKMLDESIEIIKQLLEKSPQSVQGLHQLAKLKYTSQNYSEAEEYYDQILSLIPGQIDIIKEYGVMLRDFHNIDKAVALFSEAAKANDSDWELHCHLAIAFEKAQNLALALDSYSKARDLNPNEISLIQKCNVLENTLSNSKV